MGLTAHNLTKMAQTIPLKLRNTCFRKDSYICVYAHKCEVPDEETQLFLRTLQEWMLGTNPVTVALQAEVSHAEYMTADSLRATKFFLLKSMEKVHLPDLMLYGPGMAAVL